jgi:hypothetical protein
MSVQQTQTDASDASGTDSMDRRTFLKTVGVGAGGLAVGASGVGPSPVGESEAFLPVVGAVGVGVLAGGALGFMIESEYEVLSGDAPPDSLGPSALKDQVYQTAKTRKSTNQSTLTDNQNLVTYVKEPAFVDGKVAAVGAINNGKTKAEVESAAVTAANGHIATVEKNLLNSWNEALSELDTMISNLSNAGVSGFLQSGFPSDTNNKYALSVGSGNTVTLSDGSTMDIKRAKAPVATTRYWSPVNYDGDGTPSPGVVSIASEGFNYLNSDEWSGVWDGIQQVQTDVTNNLVTWVDTAYQNVQQGDLNPDELLSPTDLADQYQGEDSLAVAHLQALNIPNAGDNEVQIRVSDQYNSTMQGLLAYSEGLSSELSEGDVIDPNATDSNGDPVYPGDFYISHNLSSWSADVTSKYDTQYGIQAGEIRATSNPKEMYGNPVQGVIHVVNTPAGVAQIPVSDFSQGTDGSGNTIWTANISDQLSQDVTDINDVSAVVSEDAKGANNYRTEKIENQFEVLQTQNGPISFEQPREPQTDSNYLEESEWDNFEQQTRENVEAWRDSQSPSIPGPGDVFDGVGSTLDQLGDWALYGIAAILGIFALNAASS